MQNTAVDNFHGSPLMVGLLACELGDGHRGYDLGQNLSKSCRLTTPTSL